VRIVAHRSLRSLPGYSRLEYTFDASEADRKRAIEEVRRAFPPAAGRAAGDPAVLILPGGESDVDRVRSLISTGDQSPAGIGE
jgi:hypothetical protein